MIIPGKNVLLVDPVIITIPERLYLSQAAAIHGAKKPRIRSIAASLRGSLSLEGFVRSSVQWVGKLSKFRDPPGVDMIAGPEDVLDSGGGDCLTLCTLLLAILLAGGISGELQRMCLPGDDDHVIVKAYPSERFVLLDPTAERPDLDVVSSLGMTGALCNFYGTDDA